MYLKSHVNFKVHTCYVQNKHFKFLRKYYTLEELPICLKLNSWFIRKLLFSRVVAAFYFCGF